MRKLSLISSGILVFVLVGCAAVYTRWTGPSSNSQQDFMNIRYQCLKETQARVSSAYINQYGGSSSSNVRPPCSAWNACMASKGYYQSDTTDASVFNRPGNFSVPESALIYCQP